MDLFSSFPLAFGWCCVHIMLLPLFFLTFCRTSSRPPTTLLMRSSRTLKLSKTPLLPKVGEGGEKIGVNDDEGRGWKKMGRSWVLFFCYQPSCVVSQLSWFGLFCFINCLFLVPLRHDSSSKSLRLLPPPPRPGVFDFPATYRVRQCEVRQGYRGNFQPIYSCECGNDIWLLWGNFQQIDFREGREKEL